MEIVEQYSDLSAALQVNPGLTALVGGGGKTTLLFRLGHELSAHGTVILSTSTHMFRPDGITVLDDPCEEEVSHALRRSPLIFIGLGAPGGKMTACGIPWQRLAALSDYVLIEADGAKGFPIKAPAPHEPVIPDCANLVLGVAGLDAIGKAIEETAHRPALLARLLGVGIAHRLVPHDIAHVLVSEQGQKKCVPACARYSAVLNKADNAALVRLGYETASHLNSAQVACVLITSLLREVKPC